MATLLYRAPWLFFGLFAGWIADRVDRRRLVLIANVLRMGVLSALTVFIVTDVVNVAVVLVAMFALGTAETFVDTGAHTLLPMLVDAKDLGVGNARLVFGRRAINDLIGPPIGAALFALGLAVPFVAQAVTIGLGAVLIGQLKASAPAEITAVDGIRADIKAGIRWLWHNPPIRTLAITVVLFNLTFGAMWPMLVLYSSERLGMGEVGFGLLLSAGAIGGVIGALAYDWLEAHFSLANLMRIGLAIETFTHLGLALSTVPVLSMLILGVFGVQTSVWGTISSTIRQRVVPENFQGRVDSVYSVGVFGGLVVGGVIGAVISGIWGVLAPFWFGFVGSALLITVLWRELGHIAHE